MNFSKITSNYFINFIDFSIHSQSNDNITISDLTDVQKEDDGDDGDSDAEIKHRKRVCPRCNTESSQHDFGLPHGN